MKNLIICFALVSSLFTLGCEVPVDEQNHYNVTIAGAPESTLIPLEVESGWEVSPREEAPTPHLSDRRSTLRDTLQIESVRNLFEAPDLQENEPRMGFRIYDSAELKGAVSLEEGRVNIRAKRMLTEAAFDVHVDDEQVREQSVRLALDFGVSPDEVGTVLQKEFKRAILDEATGERRDEVLAHVTFIERQVGGVPVVGSRLIVMHDREGEFAKIVGWWPTIHAENSRLAPELSPEEISRVFSEDIQRERLRLNGSMTDGPERYVDSRYVLFPTQEDDGRVSLNLQLEYVILPVNDAPLEESFKPLEMRIDI